MIRVFDWMEVIQYPHQLKAQRGRKGQKRERDALRRQEKIAAHRTRNGRGCVARLMRKNK